MKQALFYIIFEFDDTGEGMNFDRNITKAFLHEGAEYESDDFDDFFFSVQDKYQGSIEPGSYPVEGLDSFGAASTEFDEKNINALMEDWRQYFISRGGKVTPIVEVGKVTSGDHNDLDIYNEVRNQLKG
jgi:hypothetical protein